jgi:hypothetical protein
MAFKKINVSCRVWFGVLRLRSGSASLVIFAIQKKYSLNFILIKTLINVNEFRNQTKKECNRLN